MGNRPFITAIVTRPRLVFEAITLISCSGSQSFVDYFDMPARWRYRSLGAALALMALAFGNAPVAAADARAAATPIAAIEEGSVWQTQNQEIRVQIKKCDDGALCGAIVWLASEAADAGRAVGRKAKRGFLLLTGFFPTGDGLRDGRIVDPRSGRAYKSRVKVIDSQSIRVEGCVAVLCRGQVWTRVDDDIAAADGLAMPLESQSAM